MDALERLMAMAERKLANEAEDVEAGPLAGLSPKELRRRFDEYGNPREGFDMEGNPISSEDNDNGELNPKARVVRKRAERRRTGWE